MAPLVATPVGLGGRGDRAASPVGSYSHDSAPAVGDAAGAMGGDGLVGVEAAYSPLAAAGRRGSFCGMVPQAPRVSASTIVARSPSRTPTPTPCPTGPAGSGGHAEGVRAHRLPARASRAAMTAIRSAPPQPRSTASPNSPSQTSARGAAAPVAAAAAVMSAVFLATSVMA